MAYLRYILCLFGHSSNIFCAMQASSMTMSRLDAGMWENPASASSLQMRLLFELAALPGSVLSDMVCLVHVRSLSSVSTCCSDLHLHFCQKTLHNQCSLGPARVVNVHISHAVYVDSCWLLLWCRQIGHLWLCSLPSGSSSWVRFLQLATASGRSVDAQNCCWHHLQIRIPAFLHKLTLFG